MQTALTFLTHYNQDGDNFFDHIVAGDEPWTSLQTPETKHHSMEWHHSNLPIKLKKASSEHMRNMVTVFWDRNATASI